MSLANYFGRTDKATNPQCKVACFAKSTSMGTLQTHLAAVHLHEWVAACNKEKIKISAKSVQEFVMEYQNNNGEEGPSKMGERKRKPYSRKGFVNAIVEFIVTDDQVGLHILASIDQADCMIGAQCHWIATTSWYFSDATCWAEGIRYSSSYDHQKMCWGSSVGSYGSIARWHGGISPLSSHCCFNSHHCLLIRSLWGKFRSQRTCGQILTYPHSWPSQHTGSRVSQRTQLMALSSCLNWGQTSLVSRPYLDGMTVSILLMLSYMSLMILRSLEWFASVLFTVNANTYISRLDGSPWTTHPTMTPLWRPWNMCSASVESSLTVLSGTLGTQFVWCMHRYLNYTYNLQMFSAHCESSMQGSSFCHHQAWFCHGDSSRSHSQWPSHLWMLSNRIP